MPLNSLLVKTSSLNPIINPPSPASSSTTTTTTTNSAKKLISNGFLSLIGRSNSNNNKSSTSTEENKQLRRTSSTQLRAQRKAKQQTTPTAGTNGNQRLSADVESLFPVSSINNNHGKLSNDDIQTFDKATTDQNIERTSSISLVTPVTDKNSNTTTISKFPQEGQFQGVYTMLMMMMMTCTQGEKVECIRRFFYFIRSLYIIYTRMYAYCSLDSSLVSCTKTNMNKISTPISTNSPATTTTTTTTILQADEGDSLNNGLLFQPVTDRKCDYVLHNHQTTQKEPFFLSPPKSLSNGDESTMMQTSTLIISTPPQYHYYLYPPINNPTTLSSSSPTSSSTSSSSSSAKKPLKILSNPNRTVSNVSINSVSTNSSSSCPSFESQTPDNDYQQSSQTPLNAEDETFSSSTYSMTTNNHNNNNINQTKTRQKKVVQSALIDWKMKSFTGTMSNVLIKPKPVILSDSVQAFWPPPPSPATLDKDLGLTTVTLTTEQVNQ